jgi:hypothetical protein
MTKLQEGQVWMTKPNPTGKLVGYQVTGVGQDFVAFQPLGHTNTHYLTHTAFYAMFDYIGQQEEN